MFSEKFVSGLYVSGYGLAGVFLVLILFYFITKLMMTFANKKGTSNN